MLNGCLTLLNRIELGSILFNKLPLVELCQPIVFEFGVTWLGVNKVITTFLHLPFQCSRQNAQLLLNRSSMSIQQA